MNLAQIWDPERGKIDPDRVVVDPPGRGRVLGVRLHLRGDRPAVPADRREHRRLYQEQRRAAERAR